jgi:lantibiotic modifying enzyme
VAEWLLAEARWGIVNDIVSGAAGVGLFLLRAAEELREPRYLVGARAAGDWLLAEATREKTGLRWRLSRDFARVYPNFSHGTSGIAYFLAVLHERTNDERYRRAALDGAAWLKAVCTGGEDGAAWYRHDPDARELCYVGWCHGPAGTARLFRALRRESGDWEKWERACARWIMNNSVPKPLAGFWNVSVCCGTAGVGEFFEDLHRATGESEYRRWAERMADDLVAKAAPGEPGLKWVQAEHRVKPDDVRAQTGYMQGAAGIGLFFLKMHGERFVPPDSPY